MTFGKFDQPRFRATYGWGVAGMIDVQPCLGAVFGALLEDMYAFPRLAEAAVWVLGHDVDKQHQTSNGWEEPGQLRCARRWPGWWCKGVACSR